MKPDQASSTVGRVMLSVEQVNRKNGEICILYSWCRDVHDNEKSHSSCMCAQANLKQ